MEVSSWRGWVGGWDAEQTQPNHHHRGRDATPLQHCAHCTQLYGHETLTGSLVQGVDGSSKHPVLAISWSYVPYTSKMPVQS